MLCVLNNAHLARPACVGVDISVAVEADREAFCEIQEAHTDPPLDVVHLGRGALAQDAPLVRAQEGEAQLTILP
jgi:hypothetical protein